MVSICLDFFSAVKLFVVVLVSLVERIYQEVILLTDQCSPFRFIGSTNTFALPVDSVWRGRGWGGSAPDYKNIKGRFVDYFDLLLCIYVT